MSRSLRLPVVLLVLGLLAGCTGGSALPKGGGTAVGGGKDGAEVPLAEGTCWTGALLGADPQQVLRLSGQLNVSYFVAAHALADRPAFARTQDCRKAHDVEVYRAVRIPSLTPQLTSYAVLLRTDRPFFASLTRAVENACMNAVLSKAAAQSGVGGAVMAPALPDGMKLGWAPPSPDQFSRGQRVFACTLTQDRPSPVRYADVFTKRFGTGRRICIDSRVLIYVDCARKHDRERIAVIDARAAVLAKNFPGPSRIRTGPDGRYLDVPPGRYAALDRACTAYLRAISTTKKLTGVAEIDADSWPDPGGAYPIACEADTHPNQQSVTTEGSVYDKS
jgi:hypothetical protein